MEFRIRKDARDWFRDIKSDFKSPSGTPAPDFDAFYFCFIAGITKTQKKDVSTSDTAELVENFPGAFKKRGKVLIGLFLSMELRYLGVTLQEKESVHAEISRLVRPGATNFLSDEGVREFNKYAHGGYDVLLDWFVDGRPRTLDYFLRQFRTKVKGELENIQEFS
ncbi:MAG: hypothetical protein OXE41_10280 [Gammaproteobacteria bacterium]|nr:hypothetical protein [Gammaproteobacteria bacterium]